MRTGFSFPLAMCLLVTISLSANAEDKKKIPHTKDTLKTVKKNVKSKKAILVDVREKREWNQGHLKDARLMPLSELEKTIGKSKLPKDKIIYCHCRSGRRVLAAAPIFKRNGYDIRPLKAGYDALRKAGFEKAEKKDASKKKDAK